MSAELNAAIAETVEEVAQIRAFDSGKVGADLVVKTTLEDLGDLLSEKADAAPGTVDLAVAGRIVAAAEACQSFGLFLT